MIMPISETHKFMLTRKLVYTAITRGKQKVIFVGKNAFEEALQENEKTRGIQTLVGRQDLKVLKKSKLYCI